MGYQRFAGLTAFFFGVLLVMHPANANTEELKSFKDWQVYKQETSQGRICFMSSVPKKLRGDYDRSNRGETRVFVSHGPDKAERNVVQIVAGYRYKPQSDVMVTIDGKKFTLFTIEDRAYASSEEDDLRMIAEWF